jgi:uncharacterized protein with beta-barrel porin domain
MPRPAGGMCGRPGAGRYYGLVGIAAQTVVLALAMMLLAGEAQAACTPASANNVTATCSGTTTNQGGGAPGASAGADGYGTGVTTGITVNVTAGAGNTVTGNNIGVYVGAGTVTNNAGASITGGNSGIVALSGAATVTNSGSIIGTTVQGIYANTDATVTNNAGASVTGGDSGIVAFSGAATVANSGSITGTTVQGIYANTDATVTNYAGASITGNASGIVAFTGAANVTNSGSITGTTVYGIYANTDAIVTNSAGASVMGAASGIVALNGAATITNSGSITATTAYGIYGNTDATVTNNAGASIAGGLYGISAANGAATVTNSGSISGMTGIYANTNATVTNNAGGSIASSLYGIDAGGGGSTVFNAGAISGGTAAIRFAGSGNTLTLGPGSLISGTVLGAGADTFQLGGSGTATFDVSQIGGGAQYQGFGTFNKIGGSTWPLAGPNTAPAWTVQQGALDVSGTIGATTVTGGTLMGTGTVGNTRIDAGGAFTPGNGTAGSSLNVAGNLAFASGASYVVQVDPASASLAKVTGTAALGGATVDAIFANGTYVARRYTILTAAGGISGSFAGVTNFNLPANVSDTLSYDANNAYLNFKLSFASPGGLNQNQQAVGNALIDSFNTSGGIPSVYATLSPAALSQAAGETATGSQQTTFAAMTQFMGMMTDVFVDGRGDAPSAGGGAAGYADEDALAHGRKPNDALAAIDTEAPPPVREFEHWSLRTATFGGSQTIEGGAVGSNTASRIAGTAVGADYRFSPDTIAGFALAGGGTSFSVANNGAGQSDLFQAGAFVRHNAGPAYVSAALAYGWQHITTDRTLTIAGTDRLRASFNANAYSGRLEGGYRFVAPWIGGIGITPYAAGQFTTFDLPPYAEGVLSGASTFALSYSAKAITDSRSELGIRTDKSFATTNGLFTLRGRFAWAHDHDPDRSIGATFQALPGASFVVNGAMQVPDSVLTTLSAEMKWLNGWIAAATFEGEFSNVISAYAGKGVLRYAWWFHACV